ncbi:hypothetical protein JTE90_021871 [Oedothorax gibbosus]|uniref:Glyoxylate reductase 1 homolog n=1 Tax=Oedothorax gibbosus TaxID=931172 RepID=A0AAV6UZY3_9ARAC|nr:hypothetical protein JTE90_021871 [Oedothorax gibbosus]
MLSRARSSKKKSHDMMSATKEIQKTSKKSSKNSSKLIKPDKIKKEPLDPVSLDQPSLILPSTSDIKPELCESQKGKRTIYSQSKANIKVEKKAPVRGYIKKKSASDISNDNVMLSRARSLKKKSRETKQASKEYSENSRKLIKPDKIKKEPLDSVSLGQTSLISLPSTSDIKTEPCESQKGKRKFYSQSKANIKVEKKAPVGDYIKICKRSASDISNDSEDDLDLNGVDKNLSSILNGPMSDPCSSSSAGPSGSSTKQFVKTTKKIGFLGLGMMGRQMVQRLLDTEHSVTFWNRSFCVDYNSFLQQGAKAAPNPAAVIQECDIIICCVSDSEAVKSVVFGKYGVLEGLNKQKGNKSYVEMSSIDLNTSVEVAEAITGKRGRYLEAPMIGQRQDVTNNSIIILAAGNQEVFNECTSMFAAWAKHVFYTGIEVGKATKFSLLLNMMMATTYSALSENLAVVERSGTSPRDFMSIIGHSDFAFPLLMDMGRKMLSNNDTVNTPVKHLQKNLFSAISLGNEFDQPLQLAVAANSQFTRALAHDPDSDVSSIHKSV